MPSPKLTRKGPQALLAAFGEHLEVGGYAGQTRKEYVRLLGRFLAFLEKQNIKEIQRVKREHLFAYQSGLIHAAKKDGKPYHAGTLNNHIASLKTFFAFLTERNHILVNPAASLKGPRVPQEMKRTPLTEREVHMIFRVIPTTEPLGLRDRAIVETLYATGIRVSEMSRLLTSDIHLQEKLLVVRKGKGGKGRMVPLSTWAVSYLKGYLKSVRPALVREASGQILFLNCRGQGLTKKGICGLLKGYAGKAGIEKKVTPHTFRHTFATHLLKHGADIRAIQEMLGHASIASTQVYTRIEISDLKAVHRRCHPRERYRSRVPDLPAVLTSFYHKEEFAPDGR